MTDLDEHMSKYGLPRTFNIPAKLSLDSSIPDEYKALYSYIEFRASARGYIWHENKTLALHLMKSESSIERGLRALQDANYIFIDKWVKKGKLYHQSFRKVIWIREDYDKKLALGSNYSISRPLPFSTWKKRFIEAILDSSKINNVLWFFPTHEYMGSLGVSFDASINHLFRFKKKDLGYEVINMTASQAEETYNILYDFYCKQHQSDNPERTAQVKDEDPKCQIDLSFKDLQNFIRSNYIDKTILIDQSGTHLTVNVFGMLMRITQNGKEEKIDTDKALELWQWLFANQDKIIKLEQGGSNE